MQLDMAAYHEMTDAEKIATLTAWHDTLRAAYEKACAERDEARLVIRKARQRLYDARGREPETVAQVIRAVGGILRQVDTSDA